MADPQIVDALQALSLSDLSDTNCLLFCPDGQNEGLKEAFSEIPRYLFRVFTPKSRSVTDASWTKSMDARADSPSSKVDIFARNDKWRVASMVYTHLRWWPSSEDNLVSWTSSLLFALVYIFHLHANSRDSSAFDEIFLCIIDTTKFPERAFIRDMDLIEAYLQHDRNLEGFKRLRLDKDYYFGEYLSQGALKIENKCRIVSAQAMIDKGLCDLRAEFEEFSKWDCAKKVPWAKPVLEIRKDMSPIAGPELKVKMKIVVDIAELFEPTWALPVAANLVALLPQLDDDVAITVGFRGNAFPAKDRADCSGLKTKIMPYGMPEVERFSKIMRRVYKDFCVEKLKNSVGEAEAKLGSAVVFLTGCDLENEDLSLLESMNKAVKGRLDNMTLLHQMLQRMLAIA